MVSCCTFCISQPKPKRLKNLVNKFTLNSGVFVFSLFSKIAKKNLELWLKAILQCQSHHRRTERFSSISIDARAIEIDGVLLSISMEDWDSLHDLQLPAIFELIRVMWRRCYCSPSRSCSMDSRAWMCWDGPWVRDGLVLRRRQRLLRTSCTLAFRSYWFATHAGSTFRRRWPLDWALPTRMVASFHAHLTSSVDCRTAYRPIDWIGTRTLADTPHNCQPRRTAPSRPMFGASIWCCSGRTDEKRMHK